MRSAGSPSHRAFSPFRCESATITGVNKSTYTVSVKTEHSDRNFDELQTLQPYLHPKGDGIIVLPDVGAECLLGIPSDNTTPFIMGFRGVASVLGLPSGAANMANPVPGGSQQTVTHQSSRPDMQPGDMGMVTRDGSFVLVRRGGVVQVGSSSLAQRLYLPVGNYIRDFCETYSLDCFGGDITWNVEQQEDDPSGSAPTTYLMHTREFAQDAKATVRIRHTPLQSPGGGAKTAWDIVVAPQGIDSRTGDVASAVYTLSVLMDGTCTEFIGASRKTTVQGKDQLSITGDRLVTVGGVEKHTVTGDLILKAGPRAILEATGVLLGGAGAISPGVLGDILYPYLASLTMPVTVTPAGMVAGPPAVPPPLAMLSSIVRLR